MELTLNLPPQTTSRQTAVSFCTMFFSPLATLAMLRDKPRVMIPMLVAAMYAVAVNYYVVARIGLDRLMAAAIKANEAIDPQAALDNAMAHKNQIMIFQGLSTFAGTFVAALAIALVLWLVIALAGKDATYKQILSVVAHVTLLTSVIRGSMLALTATVAKDLDHLDLRNPLATNLGFFLQTDSRVWSRVFSSLDVITLSTVVLIAVGLSKVGHRVSLASACVMVAVPWAVYIAASVLLPSVG